MTTTPLPLVSDYEDLLHTSPDATSLLEEMSRRHLEFLASEKTCRVCDQVKSRSEFPVHSHSHDGRDSRCRDCKNQQTRLRAAWKKQHPAPPVGDECPICHKATDRWVLDHCHETDEMRGYICDRCNSSLGGFDDNPDFLDRAAAWVRGRGTNPDPKPFPSHIKRHLL